MDAKELEFIAKRVETTTPAPWVTGSIPWQVWYDGGRGRICRVESCASDREFIAHARQDVPALLDEVAKLNLQNDEMKKLLRAIVEPIFKADEAKDKDAHTFCNCMCCQAWAIYENDKTDKRVHPIADAADAEPTGANQHSRSGLCWCSLFHDMG